MAEWRHIWKECVNASQKSLLVKDLELNKYFSELFNRYGDDKMISFEKAITYECIGNLEKAKQLYIASADESTGLPVSHWRKRAQYYLDRNGQNIVNYDDYFCTQWDVFFNLHSYIFLHPHIRYLAISSVSRVNNEPEMAAVIFRTCLEICLELYWSISIDKNDYFLGQKIKSLFSGKVENKLERDFNLILEEGNLAAHPFKKKKEQKGESQTKKIPKINRTKEKPFEYKNKDISKILKSFEHVMEYCNSQAKTNGRGILYKDLDIIF